MQELYLKLFFLDKDYIEVITLPLQIKKKEATKT